MTHRRNLPGLAWLIAFLLMPAGPYGALYLAGAVTGLRVAGCAAITLVLSAAFTLALVRTEGQPMTQSWVLQSMLLFMGVVALHQYHLGRRRHLWPRHGLRVWTRMAWIGVALLVLSLAADLIALLTPGRISS